MALQNLTSILVDPAVAELSTTGDAAMVVNAAFKTVTHGCRGLDCIPFYHVRFERRLDVRLAHTAQIMSACFAPAVLSPVQ